MSKQHSRFAAAMAAISIALGAVSGSAFAWQRPHSDGPNSGFADVDTLPAESPRVVSGLGTFAPGSGPAIAADGTVYLGNLQGQVIALEPDGTRKWAVGITPGFSIVAPPVIDSSGGIFVVGTRTAREAPSSQHKKSVSILYRFNAKGLITWQNTLPDSFDGPNVSAAPNIWKIPNEPDVIMVMADHHNRVTGGYDTWLLAYATNGTLINRVKVKTVVYQATGSSDMPLWCVIPPMMLGCLLSPDFNPSGAPPEFDPSIMLPEGTVAPRPGPAIFTYPGGGTPFILASNQFQDLVAYTFANRQFQEIFRIHDESRYLIGPPMVMPDGHTVIGVSGDNKGKLVFAGPNMNALRPAPDITTYATATRLANGRLAVVDRYRKLAILNGRILERTIPLQGDSIAPAAASRTHVFVSTAGAFATFDPVTWQQLAVIHWVGGGTITPAIGPQGHVYGMASNVLFAFPAPRPATVAPIGPDPGTPGVIDPSPPAATAAAQRFNGPVTPTGDRLFACQELDGDDCGKSTNKAVALAFCQQKGFTKIGKVDTETRKGKAARLDGQLCSKEKCKVFDEIECKN